MRISLLFCVFACSSTAKNTLTRVDEEASCAGGGVRLSSGIDDDADGVLADAEIESSQTVCSDVAVTLPSGETPPPLQLVRTISLAAEDTDCPEGGVRILIGLDNGDQDSVARDNVLQDGEIDEVRTLCQASSPLLIGSFDLPSDPVGTASIVVGPQNGISIQTLAPSYGGHIKLSKNGSIDASLPNPPTAPSTGARSCDAPDGGSTLPTGSTKPASGLVDDCWISDFGNTLMKDNEPATGLFVSADASLQVRNLRVNGPIVNEGTLTATTSTVLTSAGYFGAQASVVNARTLSFNTSTFVNQGTITCSNGLDGFPLAVTAQFVQNTGLLDTHGEENETGGDITVRGTDGVLLAGTLDAHTTGGANAGDVRIIAGTRFISSANLIAHGGLGGSVVIETVGADAFITGLIDTHGNDSLSVPFRGGDVSLEITQGALYFGASINARGGVVAGSAQDTGGSLSITHTPTFGDVIVIAGVSVIDTGGGEDLEPGGDIVIGPQDVNAPGIGGAIISDIPIVAHGGIIELSTRLTGQSAGVERIILAGDIDVSEPESGGSIIVRAKDDISSSGVLRADGKQSLECILLTSVVGNIDHSGTASCSGTAAQGNAGIITMSAARVTHSGTAQAQGFNGGAGGVVQLVSSMAESVVTGSISAATTIID